MPFLMFGVDRIEAGVYVAEFERTTREIRSQLREAKERVRNTREPEYIDLGPYRFEVQPHTGGAPWYDYFLKHPHYLVWVAEEERGEQPPIRVAVLSEALWAMGQFAWFNLINLLESAWGLRYERSKLSRIDPCVDQDVHVLTHRDLDDIVCRGRYVGPYDPTAPDVDKAFDVRIWMQRRRGELPLTGLQLGRRGSGIMARLYNKHLEIVQASGKRWFWDLWRRAGWAGFRTIYDPETGEVKGREPVTEPWRIEFEVHREVLKAIAAEPDGPAIESVEDAFDLLPRLWRYLTTSWLRFVDKQSDRNTTRARVRRWWRQVQDPPQLPPAPAAVRIKPALTAKEETYARAALGYLASLGGLWQTDDLRTVLARLERWAQENHELPAWIEKAQTRKRQLNPMGVTA